MHYKCVQVSELLIILYELSFVYIQVFNDNDTVGTLLSQ